MSAARRRVFEIGETEGAEAVAQGGHAGEPGGAAFLARAHLHVAEIERAGGDFDGAKRDRREQIAVPDAAGVESLRIAGARVFIGQ